MPQSPLHTLSIFEKGNTYTIYDTDDKTLHFTIRFDSRSLPQMTVIRASDPSSIVGSATYHPAKKFGLPTGSNISHKIPSTCIVSLNREGGFFSNDKRTMRSAVLGHVCWSGRHVNNPWKGGRLERRKTLVEYRDEGHTLKRMGVWEIGVELAEDGLDEVVVSGTAMMSEEQTGVRAHV